MVFICDTFHYFWRRHPALLYGLSFALGVSSAIAFDWMMVVPALLLIFPIFCRPPQALQQRLLLAIGVGILAYFYTSTTVLLPKGEIPLEGEGVVSFSTLTKKNKYSREIWEYRGTMKEFKEKSSGILIAKNIPCIITLNLKKESWRPQANRDYILKGSLVPPKGYFSRMESNKEEWVSIPNTISFAEYRYHAKCAVSDLIRDNVPERRVYEFLKGIATGDFDDLELQFEFSRFGLQHIMAISGFHFAIVAGFFVFFIRFFAPRKVAALILMFLMCSYFVFLGATPSIMRAWMMILVVIGGCFSERLSNGLNSLGIAMLAILFIDPSMVYHIGFQFSALITGAILLGYTSVDFFLQRILIRRPLYEVIHMPMRDQHGYCILVVFRKILALSLTVNWVSAPLAIYYFQKFPLMGLIYNWFFPFMVSLSIALLISALLMTWIPPLAACIHAINTRYTSTMLDIVYNMPTSLDFYVRYQELSAPIAIALISFTFLIAVFVRTYVEKGCQEKKDFAFI